MKRLAAAGRGIRSSVREVATPTLIALSLLGGALAGPAVLALLIWADARGVGLLVIAGVIVVGGGALIAAAATRSGDPARITGDDRILLRNTIRSRKAVPDDEAPSLRHVATTVRREELRVLLALAIGLVPFLIGFFAGVTMVTGFPDTGTSLFIAPAVVAVGGILRLGSTQLLLERLPEERRPGRRGTR